MLPAFIVFATLQNGLL